MRRWTNPFRALAALICVVTFLTAVPAATVAAQNDFTRFGVVLGGSGNERIYSLVQGPSGEFYLGGETNSNDLPVTAGALDQTSAGGEGFVARFSPAGELEWMTYLGGSGPDAVYDLALGDGALYAVGATSSLDFPGARPVNGEKDGFAAAISLDGSALYYATLLGGSDQEAAYAVAVDGSQAAVTGISYSTDFSPSTYSGAGDAFVARLDAAGSPAFIALFGGRGVDAGFDLALQNGDIWVAGQTFSINFPARGLKGLQDGFVMRLDGNGSIKWATLVGGSGEDNVQSLALDPDGNVWITGLTGSSDFPPGSELYGLSDTYLARLSAEGSLNQSVRIGGTGEELGRTVALDGADRVILCGFTTSADFPVTPNAAQGQAGGRKDAVIASFGASGLSSPDQYYGTFLGGGGDETCNGLVATAGGNALWAGETGSGAPSAFVKLGSGGGQDGLIAALAVLPPGSAPAPTAALLPASPTPVVVRTPTIPLIYTPPPATATLPAAMQLPTTMATLAPAAEQTAAAGTEIEVTQLTPAGVTATAGESPVSTGDTVATEPTSSPTSEENSSTGWWVGGIVVIIALGTGGWYLIQKNRK